MLTYEELTTGPLASEITPFRLANNYSAIYNILTRKDIPTKGDVETSKIKAFLFVAGFWNTIKHGTSSACEEAIDALTLFETLQLGNSLYLTRLTTVLDALVAEPLIPDFTVTHKEIILSFGDTFISRADQLGIQPTLVDIYKACINGQSQFTTEILSSDIQQNGSLVVNAKFDNGTSHYRTVYVFSPTIETINEALIRERMLLETAVSVNLQPGFITLN